MKTAGWLLVSIMALFIDSTYGQVTMPGLFRDSMILQRDVPVSAWGWARPGEKISISFAGHSYRTTTKADSSWKVVLKPTKAGGPYTMHINASNHLTISNILMGDVWLCSGQSNMQHQLQLHAERYAAEIAQSSNENIRQFLVPAATNLQQPSTNINGGSWKAANPTNVLQFSAVAYFFAKALYEKYHVPIGIINASVGGTPIEAWMSEQGLQSFPDVVATINKNKDSSYVNNTNRAAMQEVASLPPVQDEGLSSKPRWFDNVYEPIQWRNITVPGYWEDQGIRNLDGVVWYRKEINLPAAMAGQPCKVALGRIVDADEMYINGVFVGSTGYLYPQRRYSIKAGVLKAGKNILVVRVINNNNKGGFVPDKPYYIAGAGDTVDIRGEWKYKVGAVFKPYIAKYHSINVQNQPTALYNAMIAPYTGYNIKGFAWYQGESNVSNAGQYQQLLTSLIADWRSKWKQENLPFLFVQLPNYDDVQYLPAESPWAVMRDGQRRTLSVDHTGMAVTIDVGEWNDIHPDRKKEVGDRLALAAEKVAYGDDVVYSGPLYQSSLVKDSVIEISFTSIGSGLQAKNSNELKGFAIADADKKFQWAKAVILDNNVVVSNNAIPHPKYVRYAWADNPAEANLYNQEGLPASPFTNEGE